jgi:uncharacterized protein (PEP-CTERM system associated)
LRWAQGVSVRCSRAKRTSRTWRGSASLLLVVGIALSALPSRAADWTIKPSIAFYGSYTSNAELAPLGQGEPDFFTTLVPAIDVRADTARLKLDLNYSLAAIAYADHSDLNQLRNNLNFTSTLTLLPELLFVDGAASVQQVPINGQLATSASPLAATNNEDTVAVYAISPHMKNHFGSFADSEFRYTFSQVFAGAAGGESFASSITQLSNSTSNRLTETLVSGEEFKRLLWTVVADGQNTSYTSGASPATQSRLAQASEEYRLNRQIGLLGSVGYERISDPTFFPEPEPDGPIGSVGVKYTPSPRTSLVMNLNHRYNSNYVTGSGSYLISPKTRIRADYTDQVYTSSQTLYTNNLSFLTTDEFGNFIDARTEQLFNLASTSFGVQNTAFRLKTFGIGFHAESGRDKYDAGAYWQNRNVFSTGENDTAIGGALSWGHELSPVTDLSVTLRYANEDFEEPLRTNHLQLVGLGGTLVYQLNDTVDGILALNFTRQFSDNPTSEFVETVISLGLQKRF